MKKIIVTLLCITGIIMFSSQSTQAQGFGISAGGNFAHFNDVDGAADSRTGLMAGITYGFSVPMSPITIRPGAFYTQKGAQVTDGNIESTTKLNYLEVPVVGKFDFILDNPALTPHVYFGPYVGFLLNAEQEVSGGGSSGSTDISDEINNTDLGVVVGAGVDINRFKAGIRYSTGLTEVAKNDFLDGKNGAFSIVLGIKL